jgi:hypothetical protein
MTFSNGMKGSKKQKAKSKKQKAKIKKKKILFI